MMLVELGSVSSAALPVADFSDHLHLGNGFSDDGEQDGLLEAYLRSAISTIEMRIGKALFQRLFSWSVTRWSNCAHIGLPVGPVAMITSVKLVQTDGSETLIDPARYSLDVSLQRPMLVGVGGDLPNVPSNGHAEIEFEAGFGPAWTDIPAALRHAVILQAAYFYECRGGQDARAQMPIAVTALIEGFRPLRLGGGGK